MSASISSSPLSPSHPSVSSSSFSSSSSGVIPSRVLPSRSTRGLRLSSLHGEGDDEFWNQEFFSAEGDGEEDDYEVSEEEEDVVDSDFFESEDDEEEAEEETEDTEGTKRRRAYVDPRSRSSQAKLKSKAISSSSSSSKHIKSLTTKGKIANQRNGFSSSSKVEEVDDYVPSSISPSLRSNRRTHFSPSSPSFAASAYLTAVRKSSRSSTIEQGEKSLHRKEKATKVHRPKAVFKLLTQEEQLAQAVETEQINKESLLSLLKIEEEKKKTFVRKNKQIHASITFQSKIGGKPIPNNIIASGGTIGAATGGGNTRTRERLDREKEKEIILMRSVLSTLTFKECIWPLPLFAQLPAELPTRHSSLSSTIAKYLHPVTGQTFNNAEEYKVIQRNKLRGEEEKEEEKGRTREDKKEFRTVNVSGGKRGNQQMNGNSTAAGEENRESGSRKGRDRASEKKEKDRGGDGDGNIANNPTSLQQYHQQDSSSLSSKRDRNKRSSISSASLTASAGGATSTLTQQVASGASDPSPNSFSDRAPNSDIVITASDPPGTFSSPLPSSASTASWNSSPSIQTDSAVSYSSEDANSAPTPIAPAVNANINLKGRKGTKRARMSTEKDDSNEVTAGNLNSNNFNALPHSEEAENEIHNDFDPVAVAAGSSGIVVGGTGGGGGGVASSSPGAAGDVARSSPTSSSRAAKKPKVKTPRGGKK